MSDNKKICWSAVSKIVGYDNRDIRYPTAEEVDQWCEIALRGELSGMVELLRWYRFLPSPQNDEQIKIINRITNAVTEYRLKYCE